MRNSSSHTYTSKPQCFPVFLLWTFWATKIWHRDRTLVFKLDHDMIFFEQINSKSSLQNASYHSEKGSSALENRLDTFKKKVLFASNEPISLGILW